jgi:hypothetical protein
MRFGRGMAHKPKLSMKKLSMTRESGGSPIDPERYLHDEQFETSDQVLLCCFGLDRGAAATRSAAQLHAALVDAGFRVTVIRHLIRTSRLLRPTGNGDYRLRDFDGPQAEN